MKDKYAVLGNPISHSKSPIIHEEFARLTHQALEYVAIEVPVDQFPEYLMTFKNSGGRGVNITIPFKQQAYKLVTECDELAKIAQSVNTIKFEENKLFGYNTDGLGMVKDLQNNLQLAICDKRILILGAGGAVRGILYSLLQQKPREVFIVNRTIKTAIDLAEKFAEFGNIKQVGLHELDHLNIDIIINGTSSSLQNETIPLPSRIFTANTFCYDMMYSNSLTLFLKQCVERGCKHFADGIGMLVEQAAEAFLIWRGIRPPTEAMLKKLRALQ